MKVFYKGGGETDTYEDHNETYLRQPYCLDQEISNSDLILGEVLGEGKFGLVQKAVLKRNGTGMRVAVKKLKTNLKEQTSEAEENFEEFLKEIKLWQYVGEHENVVKYIGSVTKNIRNWEAKIVLEPCELGDLKTYLENSNRWTMINSEIEQHQTPETVVIGDYAKVKEVRVYTANISDLVRWSYQIACGMQYITEKKIVHRDLAARNVLLTAERVAKVADFGLSRNFKNDKLYYVPIKLKEEKKHPIIPLRCSSPEVFEHYRFSEDSDIWAFGVTMWEIHCKEIHVLNIPYRIPYPDISEDNPLQCTLVMERVKAGRLMEKPDHANDELYKIMLSCWDMEGPSRPRFTTLKEQLWREVEKHDTGHNITIFKFRKKL